MWSRSCWVLIIVITPWFSEAAIPNILETRDRFPGRQLLHEWGRGWFPDYSSALHLFWTLFLLLVHQFHFRSSGIRTQRFWTPVLKRSSWKTCHLETPSFSILLLSYTDLSLNTPHSQQAPMSKRDFTHSTWMWPYIYSKSSHNSSRIQYSGGNHPAPWPLNFSVASYTPWCIPLFHYSYSPPWPHPDHFSYL